MIVFYGTRLYGKVDQLDDTGIHVATKFFHIYWIPLIPTASTLILSKTDDGWNGLPIPFSFKSLLAAWGRLACIPLFAVGLGETIEEPLIGIPIVLASIGFFIGSYWLFVARGKRRDELLAMIGMQVAEAEAAAAIDPLAHGPLLVQPEVGHPAIAQSMAALGLEQVAAPAGALAQFANANVAVTVQQGPIGMIALSFGGFAADHTKRQLATMLAHVGVDQIAWLLESNDPTQVAAGVSAASALQLHDFRPSVERLSSHPDPHVRAEAQRALNVLGIAPAYG